MKISKMGIRFHLDSAELMSCASGSQPEALGAVISTHLSMCPVCRHELKFHSFIGETLFNTLSDTPLQSKLPSLISNQNISKPSINHSSQKLHAVLELINSHQFDKIKWMPLAPGIEEHSLSLTTNNSGSLKLIKLCKKASIAHLERTGTQIILVLDGALTDKDGMKNKGDIVHLGPDNPYSFTANDVNGSICLIGSEATVDLNKIIN